MNEIEQMFYNAYLCFMDEDVCEDDRISLFKRFGIEPQAIVGIYKIDFAIGDCAIEIDGHEFHKTKEQREYDYKRERYLIKHGYTPVRFMATEVFLDAYSCVVEALEIADVIDGRRIDDYLLGTKYVAHHEQMLSKKELEVGE